jgi:hypothetical protein
MIATVIPRPRPRPIEGDDTGVLLSVTGIAKCSSVSTSIKYYTLEIVTPT